jgi:hypothetical protein
MTAQIHERLKYEGEELSMAYCPPIPLGHPRIAEIDVEKRAYDSQDSMILFSTACWRRYQGSWEVKDGRFYLTGLRGLYQLAGDEPLLADWFTGILRIPRGELLHYVHMGFGSVYEQELHVKIEAGMVTDSRVVDNRGKKFDPSALGWKNMPGGENRFPGDDEL